MRFGHLEIFATDLLRSLEFYQEVLGFEATTIQAGPTVWIHYSTSKSGL